MRRPSNDPESDWDADCLKAFKGKTVVYVGSWNVGEAATLGFEGTTSSKAFQLALLDKFVLKATVRLPTWPWSKDSVTVWDRKM